MNVTNRIAIALVFVVGGSEVSHVRSQESDRSTLHAGAAAVDISPIELPAIRNGGFLQATSNRVDDPLHAKCLVLADGQETLAIAIVDSCMLPTDLCDEIRSMVTRRIDLPANRILISATHTHSAPSAMSYCLGTERDPAYVNFVAPRIAEAIVAAHDRLAPAKVGWTAVDASELTNCRRWITRRDRMGSDPFGERTVRAMMHPGYLNPDYVCPAGPIDPQLSILSVVAADDEAPLCLMANFSMHYFGAGGGFSADYFGEVAVLLEEEIGEVSGKPAPNFVGMMSQGTSGDLHWMDYHQPRRSISRQQYSRDMANRILDAWSSIEHRSDAGLAMAETRLKIGRRIPTAERLQWARALNEARGDRLPANRPEVYAQQAEWIFENQQAEVVVQAVRIGDLGITALPNEVYGITGLKLKQQSPLAATFNLELANGAEGYIPPPEQHRLGGYTTWPARTAGLEESAEPKIVEAALSLLEDVSQQKRRDLIEPTCAYARSILDAQPIAYWRLGDMESDRAIDASGLHDATFHGAIALYLPSVGSEGFATERLINRSAYFAGGHLDAELNELPESYTVSMWVWNGLPAEAEAINGTLFARGVGEAREMLQIGGNAKPETTGRLVFRVGARSIVGARPLATRGWHHVALVRSPGRVVVYVDGQRDPDMDAEVVHVAESARVFVGGVDQGAVAFDGKLDEVAIFPRPLSADEVARHYATSAATPPARPKSVAILKAKPADTEASRNYAETIVAAAPVSYWRLHDGDQRTAHDVMRRGAASYEDRAKSFQPGRDEKNFYGGRVVANVPKLGNTYSVEMWIRNELAHNARSVTGYMFSRGDDGAEGAPGDNLGIGGTHSWTGRLFVYNGNERAEALSGQTTLVPGSWAHVVFVRDGESIKVYLNGDPNPEIDGRLPITYPAECEQLMIGGRNDNFANFDGMIEDVAVYDRVLEPGEVEAHFKVAGALQRESIDEDEPQAPQPTSPEDSLKQIHVRDGFEVELVASEPLIKDPVAIDWGPDGRLWVVEMADYPLGMDGQGQPGGRVKFLEDADGDGKYDTSTLFADGLSFPTGVLTWGDGVLVTAAPEILYLEDTTGDGQADLRRKLYSGFLQGNQQLRVNGLRWGLDNWVYCASGSHHAGYGKENRITSHVANTTHQIGSRDFRIRPATGEIDPQSGPSQYGRNRDDWGNWFGVQNSYPLWHYVLSDHYVRRNPHFAPPNPKRQVVTPANPRVYPASRPQKRFHSFEQSGRFTSACSAIIYRDDLLFPRDERQHAFTCEPFHNLVQHNLITADGVSFKFHRDPAEAEVDFFASEDRWCRPVMVRTGPDGALWVVDMYRYMIEHPEWLPQNGKDELRPYFREGEDAGRIYRIVPAGRPRRPIGGLADLTADDLVAALESSNGWRRDTAQRLLIRLNDVDSIAPLEKMVESSHQPLARLHALCTLDGMDGLAQQTLDLALADEHPGVRRHAVRLSADRPVDLSRLAALVTDPDPKVRMQLASTLGEFDDARAAQALAELAITSEEDVYLTAAVMSSLHNDNVASVAAAVVKSVSDVPRPSEQLMGWMELLIGQASALGDARTINQLIGAVVDHGVGSQDGRNFRLLALVLDGLSRRNWPMDRVDASLRLRILHHVRQATSIVSDMGESEDLRAAAVGLLLREQESEAYDMELMRGLLTPQTPYKVQLAVIARAAQRSDAAMADMLLSGWHAHTPRLKAEILSAVASRAEWAHRLLEQLEGGSIEAMEVSLPMRDRLLRTADAADKRRWQDVFATSSSDNRQAVVNDYRSAVELAGDATRGQAVFRKSCAACHRQGEIGHEVGPNLASLTNKEHDTLLASILDPNAAMDAKYVSYVVITTDGRTFAGMLATETGSSIELLSAEGKTQTILRQDIEEVESSGKSLMPEGLEEELSPQDVADLIHFIRESR